MLLKIFGAQDLPRVIWYSDPFAFFVLVDLMASTLSGKEEAAFPQYLDKLVSSYPGKPLCPITNSTEVKLTDSGW